MLLKKGQLSILLVNACGLAFFTAVFISRKNYEFLLYVGVIIFFLALILLTNDRVSYPNGILWGLTAWAFLHMGGGGLYLNGVKLYEIILLPISSRYEIFRYDQFVHIVGFGVATLVMYQLLEPLLKPDLRRWTALSIVVAMAGLGVGALNEIIEFIATVLVPETGVGGYTNTSLDLVADLIGAVSAVIILRVKRR
jgi:putative membrane protein